MAVLPSALASQASRPSRSDLPFVCGAKSTIVVVPPNAAAFEPVSKVSLAKVPPNGSSMCVWTSIPPGTTYLPVASMVTSAVTPAPARSVPEHGDRLAVDQHVGRGRAVGRDDEAVRDQRAHLSSPQAFAACTSRSAGMISRP